MVAVFGFFLNNLLGRCITDKKTFSPSNNSRGFEQCSCNIVTRFQNERKLCAITYRTYTVGDKWDTSVLLLFLYLT